MRVVAILAVYNEERFIAGCLDHLIRHGIDVYLIDNASTDETVSIARSYLGRGLIGIETFPRAGQYSWRPLLERKEQIAATLDADWFIHVDADEIRLPPRSDSSLAQAFAEVERRGYNAVNFLEFTFTPTLEAPDHDHPDFQTTMRWYYPCVPSLCPSQVKAWKRQSDPVELALHEVPRRLKVEARSYALKGMPNRDNNGHKAVPTSATCCWRRKTNTSHRPTKCPLFGIRTPL